ncbi:hypothetical protein ACTXT7_006198 [Hymenolepis weldensis]
MICLPAPPHLKRICEKSVAPSILFIFRTRDGFRLRIPYPNLLFLTKYLHHIAIELPNSDLCMGNFRFSQFGSYIVGQIRAKLSRWTNTWQMEKWNPSLAVPFSYWLIQNLPLTYIQKADFLKLDPVVARLRACLNFIETFSGLACAQCRSAISSQSYVICLTDEGSVQAYVNPHGFIFDMLTLSTVRQRSIALVGSPTTEYSWFPGYAWTIAECVMCGVPLGWRFTATRDDLRPRLFWGIKREALQHINEGEESQNIRWEGSELEDDESMVMSIPPEMADILDFLDSNDASLNSD